MYELYNSCKMPESREACIIFYIINYNCAIKLCMRPLPQLNTTVVEPQQRLSIINKSTKIEY